MRRPFPARHVLIFFLESLQKCKQWLLQHLIRSRTRTASLAKYLLAYANSFDARQPGDAKNGLRPGPSAKRRSLHILYILNDVFHHVKSRTRNEAFLSNIEPHLSALFRSAASFENAPKHEKKLYDLIGIWQEKTYFSDVLLNQLRAAIVEGPTAKALHSNGADTPRKGTSTPSLQDAPFTLPSMHGDASTPWYDLPAANWLPVIEPNSIRPMNPSMIRPLQLAGGPADKGLVQAVKKLLRDVDKIYAEDNRSEEDSLVDISQMGEVIERDEMGDIVSGETYYGWSRTFCEKMKARRRGDAMDIDSDRRGRGASSRSNSRSCSRSRSRDRSSSRGSSRPVFKRRRLSESRSRSRSGHRSRTPSRARNDRSWKAGRTSCDPRSYSPQHSRSRSRSHSIRRRNNDDTRSRDSYSPPPALGAPAAYGNANMVNINNNNNNNHGPPPNSFLPIKPQPMPPPPFNHHIPAPPPNFPGMPPNFLPPPPQHIQQGGFDAWNALPPPPPPPPQYQGHWPPPQPPPGMPNIGGVAPNLPQSTHQGWFPPSGAWAGGWAPPPPPPPTNAQQGGVGGYGYSGRGGGGGGGGNGEYRGRGGYGRGRGW